MRFDPSARDLTKTMMEQWAGEGWRSASGLECAGSIESLHDGIHWPTLWAR